MLSRCLSPWKARQRDSETARQLPCRQDNPETRRETVDLKALARLVLARDIRRDTERDRLSHDDCAAETPSKAAGTAETSDETPVISSPQKILPDQLLAPVSLSRISGTETAETPARALAQVDRAASINEDLGSRRKRCLKNPLIMRDGRVMHFLPTADAIPKSSPNYIRELCDRIRRAGVVLVADGTELHVVERRQGQLDPNTFQTLKNCAGAVIAILRGEARVRDGNDFHI